MVNYILLLILLSLGYITGEPDVQVSGNFLLTKHRVGQTKVGAGAYPYQLYRDYGRHAVRLIDLQLEGSFSTGLQVYIDRPDIPSFVAQYRYIWQRKTSEITSITVFDRRFRTAKGIGVGSNLGELRGHYEVENINLGEGGSVFAVVPELAMGFILDINTDLNPVPSEWWESKDQTLIPNNTQIVSIWVKGF